MHCLRLSVILLPVFPMIELASCQQKSECVWPAQPPYVGSSSVSPDLNIPLYLTVKVFLYESKVEFEKKWESPEKVHKHQHFFGFVSL